MAVETTYEALIPVESVPHAHRRLHLDKDCVKRVVAALLRSLAVVGACVGGYELIDYAYHFESANVVGIIFVLLFLPFIMALFAFLGTERVPPSAMMVVRVLACLYLATAIIAPIHGSTCRKYRNFNDVKRVENVQPQFALPSFVQTGLITLDPQYINTSLFGINSAASANTYLVYAIDQNNALMYGGHGASLNQDSPLPIQSDGRVWLTLPKPDFGYSAAISDFRLRNPGFSLAVAPVVITSSNLLQSIEEYSHKCFSTAFAHGFLMGSFGLVLFIILVRKP